MSSRDQYFKKVLGEGDIVTKEMPYVKRKKIFNLQSFNIKDKGKIMVSLCSFGKKPPKE